MSHEEDEEVCRFTVNKVAGRVPVIAGSGSNSTETMLNKSLQFERCGADVDNLQSGMKKLSTVITDAAGGSDSAAEKLSAVGLSIEDLNGK